jgi:cytoskeletal protein CcmA (bactofilin family)
MAQSQRATSGQGPTVISANVEIFGALTSPDELHVYGKIDGNVRATSVTVCEGGVIMGDIVAETLVVAGKVEGRLYARSVQMQANAVVNGDVYHNSLGIDPAAVFEGVSRRVADPLADSMFAPVAANAA